MKKNLSALFSGLLFGFGLTVSQMVNPEKVLDFLDVAGRWDASLALVMGGALLVAGLLQNVLFKREVPLLETRFYRPAATEPDKNLLTGAAIFGIGWGLAGLCPGPALAGLTSGILEIYIFILAMFAGMGLFKFLQHDSNKSS
jgi:uncharacterized protein